MASFRSPIIRSFAVAFSLLVCTLSFAARAEDSAAPRFIDRADALALAARATLENYPDADSVLVANHDRSVYHADGTAESWDEFYIKILTEKGRRESQVVSNWFTIPYSEAAIPSVEIIKPDGNVVPVNAAALANVMVDPSQMRSNIYNPNQKLVQLGVPGLEVGDILYFVKTRRIIKPRVPDTWSNYYVLEYTSPIMSCVVEVVAPASRPLRNIRLRGEIPGAVETAVEEDGDTITYRWTVRDVPRMYTEPDMPALHTVVQRLIVSTIGSWEEVSRWYWELCEPPLSRTSPEMEAEVAKLTAEFDDDLGKIAALFQFVSQNIRYMGITTEVVAPGYEPRAVDETFANRYGVCRDKAALLVAMLRLAGFESYTVLINNGPRMDEEAPVPFFNHAVTAVQLPDGPYLLMDPTDENTMELFPAYLGNQSYLVARPQGDHLRVSPIVPPDENMAFIETIGAINAAGRLSASSTIELHGVNDNAYRNFLASRRPEERHQFFERHLKNSMPGATLLNLEISPADLRDVAANIVIRMDYEAEDTLIRGVSSVIVSPPRLASSFGMVNFILRGVGLVERRYPLVTDLACGVRENIKIEIAPEIGEPILIPRAGEIDDELLGWRRSLTMDGRELRGAESLELRVVEFDPAQYRQLKLHLGRIETESKKLPIIAPPAAADVPDAEMLEDHILAELIDGSNFTITRNRRLRVNTYAGKKDNSELKFHFNPAWESVEIVEAKVVDANGREHQLDREKEINLMDADWVGAAPRYPPGKIMVVSLPGVDPGATIEYTVKREFRGRPFFSLLVPLRSEYPVERQSVTIDTPKGLEVKLDIPEQAVASEQSADGDSRLRRRWDFHPQPAIRSERNTPPAWSFVPTFLASTGDWKIYAETVGATLAAAAVEQPAATALAKTLTEGLDSEEAKIIAIRDHVARTIRGAGPGLNQAPLSAVSAADTTLADGYGNAADRAVLLHAMLAAVGIESEFVMVSNLKEAGSTRSVVETPQRFIFSGILARTPQTSNRWPIYLGDTDQYAKLGATPSLFNLAMGLDGKVERVRSSERDYEQTKIQINLDSNGDARVVRTQEYRGMDYSDFHKYFAEMNEEERSRHFQTEASAISHAASIIEAAYDLEEGTETLVLDVPGFAALADGLMTIELPFNWGDVIPLEGERRDNPVLLANTKIIKREVEVILPGGEILAMPQDISWMFYRDHRITSVAPTYLPKPLQTSKEILLDNGGIRICAIQAYESIPQVLTARNFRGLLEARRALSAPESRTILLRLAGDND